MEGSKGWSLLMNSKKVQCDVWYHFYAVRKILVDEISQSMCVLVMPEDMVEWREARGDPS